MAAVCIPLSPLVGAFGSVPLACKPSKAAEARRAMHANGPLDEEILLRQGSGRDPDHGDTIVPAQMDHRIAIHIVFDVSL
jgi:hypothetical protein